MRKMNIYFLRGFIIAITLMFCNFSANVYADDGVEITKVDKPLNVKIMRDGQEISHSDNEIYYLNHNVSLKMPNDELGKHMDEQIGATLALLKKQYNTDEIKYYVEENTSYSILKDDKFLDYAEMEGDTYEIICAETDTFSNHTVKFKIVKSVVFYREENSNKKTIKMMDINFLSPVYRFITDKRAPLIERTDSNDIGGRIRELTPVMFNIKDEAGLSKITLIKNGETIEEKDLTGDKRIVDYSYEILLSKQNEDFDSMKIHVTDISGNESEYEFNYRVDTTSPEIQIVGVTQNEIIKDKAEISVKSKDDTGKVFVFYKCQFMGESGTTQCLESLTSCFENGADFKREYTDDGIYDIAAFSYDENGNYSDIVRYSFALDKLAPEVSFDNVENKKVYGENVSLYATVSEMFYEDLNVDISVTYMDKTGIREIQVPKYAVNSCVNKNIYTFSDDGSYSVNITAEDGKGHITKKQCEFGIDKTGPEIVAEVSGIRATETGENMSPKVINKKPIITINTSDEMSEYETTASLYRKDKDGGFKEEDTEKVVSVGKSCDFGMEVKYEGEYLLKVLAKDTLGNETKKSLSFTVDEQAPIIGYLGQFNEKYLKSFSLTDKFGDYIEDMTRVRYRAYLNSKEVKTCEIKNDGKYILQVVASDEAGNKSEDMIAFIVDNTSPKVIVSGLDNGYVEKDGIVKLSLFDEDDYFKTAYVNGKSIDISGEGREIYVKADEYGSYDISVVASDYAGNEVTEEIKMSCAYSGNPFTVTLDKSQIKTLTKSDSEVSESFLTGNTAFKIAVFISVIAVSATIYCVISFVDIKNRKCDT